MLKMNYELHQLLDKVGKETNERRTHYTFYEPKTNWYISNQNLHEFWKNYNLLAKNNESNLNIAETIGDVSPLTQEFLFKFNDEGDEWEPYDEEFLVWLAYLYQQVLLTKFDLVADHNLIVAVLESERTWCEEDEYNKYVCIKIRLQFVNTRIDTQVQQNIIRKEIIKELRKNNVMSKMARQPVGDWDKIMLNEDYLLMVGSSRLDEPKLNMIHLWDRIDNLEDIPADLKEEDVFSLKNHNHVIANIIKEEELDYLLPFYLSVEYSKNTLLVKRNLLKDVVVKDNYIFNTNDKPEVIAENLDLAQKFLEMLSPHRFNRESFWLDVGKALYYIDKGKKDGLNLWIKYTTLNTPIIPDFLENNVEKTCLQHYDTFSASYLTVKTLAFFARIDNKKSYDQWHKDWCIKGMESALTGLDNDIASALYRVFWLEYTFDVENYKWYEFSIYGWKYNKDGHHLLKAISSTFLNRFEKTLAQLTGLVADDKVSNKQKSDVTVRQLNSLIAKLKSGPCKKRIMKEAEGFFENEHLSFYLDKNADLTGVKNGILEVLKDQIIFRSAKPEDYISMCANVPFITDYTWEHPLVVECLKYLKNVFPIDDLLEHFLKFGSSFFIGRNCDKIFAIFSGRGNNSKSMLVKLIGFAFGSYAVKLPASLLCEKQANSGNATPQLARTKATKLGLIDEPEDDIPMHKGAIKRYTGGDAIYVRFLNENGGDIELSFKLIMSTNGIPNIKGDEAVKNRLRIFPFLSKWVDEPPSEEEQLKEYGHVRLFKLDKNYEKRLLILAPAFLWLLSQYFPKYSKEGLISPPSVVEHTEQYWKDNDFLGMFIEDKILMVFTDKEMTIRDPSAHVAFVDLYDVFKDWYKSGYPGIQIPTRDVVKTELISRWGRPSKLGWPGISLVQSNFVIR